MVEEGVEVLVGDAVGNRHARAVAPDEVAALDGGELVRVGGEEIGDGGIGRVGVCRGEANKNAEDEGAHGNGLSALQARGINENSAPWA